MAMPRKLSDADIDTMIRLRERGWGYRSIGVRLGVSSGAIHYQCLKHAVVSPRQTGGTTPAEPSSFVAGDGRTQRRFTEADDAEMLRLEQSGMRPHRIAREMGRATTSVRIRLMTLAQREEIRA